jgi:predicted enzyme related to lactoylglutathione lyase
MNNERRMRQKLSILTLGVRDINVAVRFYEKGFGWRQEANGMNPKPARRKASGDGLRDGKF